VAKESCPRINLDGPSAGKPLPEKIVLPLSRRAQDIQTIAVVHIGRLATQTCVEVRGHSGWITAMPMFRQLMLLER